MLLGWEPCWVISIHGCYISISFHYIAIYYHAWYWPKETMHLMSPCAINFTDSQHWHVRFYGGRLLWVYGERLLCVYLERLLWEYEVRLHWSAICLISCFCKTISDMHCTCLSPYELWFDILLSSSLSMWKSCSVIGDSKQACLLLWFYSFTSVFSLKQANYTFFDA